MVLAKSIFDLNGCSLKDTGRKLLGLAVFAGGVAVISDLFGRLK